MHIQFDDFIYGGKLNLLLEDISGNKYDYQLSYDSTGDITEIKDITEIEE